MSRKATIRLHPDDKLLIVEVDFDTDPDALSFRRDVIEAIYESMIAALEEDIRLGAEAPNFITGLRIVPRRPS